MTFGIMGFPLTANGVLSAFDSDLGDVIYQPTPGFAGEDGFAFTVDDGVALSDPATVTVAVLPAWRVAIAADNSDPVQVEFGVTPGAGEGFDVGVDEFAPDPPSAGSGTVHSIPAGGVAWWWNGRYYGMTDRLLPGLGYLAWLYQAHDFGAGR